MFGEPKGHGSYTKSLAGPRMLLLYRVLRPSRGSTKRHMGRSAWRLKTRSVTCWAKLTSNYHNQSFCRFPIISEGCCRRDLQIWMVLIALSVGKTRSAGLVRR